MIDPKEKVKDFIKDYQEVAKKHGYDFYARIDISRVDGKEIKKSELDQVKKAIDRILFQYKVRMLPSMGLSEIKENGK